MKRGYKSRYPRNFSFGGNERFQGQHSVGITLLPPRSYYKSPAGHKARRGSNETSKVQCTPKTQVIITNHGTNSRATGSCKVFLVLGAYRLPSTMSSKRWFEDYELKKQGLPTGGQVQESFMPAQHLTVVEQQE